MNGSVYKSSSIALSPCPIVVRRCNSCSFRAFSHLFMLRSLAPFREPVDWKGMGTYSLLFLFISLNQWIGLTDYPVIVKKPMDLGTIRKKIKKKEYATIQEAADDVQLVWTNCSTFNLFLYSLHHSILTGGHSSDIQSRRVRLLQARNLFETQVRCSVWQDCQIGFRERHIRSYKRCDATRQTRHGQTPIPNHEGRSRENIGRN